jgi:MYXO-CTERM domain-containing protein
MKLRRPLAAALALATVALVAPAAAGDAFVTLVDDGTIEQSPFMSFPDEEAVQAKLLDLYKASGEPLPDVLSVWTTFPLGGSPYGTIFDPLAADVNGIGLGTMNSPVPPLRSILFHNDVTQLPARAALQHAPAADFARYLFLLEFTHNWGPALAVPPPNGTELVGFPYHWSFFMDAGGSPAGGNVWHDNGDGTFTTVAASPSTIAYSMVDLYIMGLATPAEVDPFGVLENVVPPATPTDPLWQGPYAAHSFPWFDTTTTLTVTATRRTLTIDDVVTANGMRDPAAGSGPKSYDLGIVLLVSGTDPASKVASDAAAFSPIADSLAPAFHEATRGRGTLHVVTHEAQGGGGSGGGSGAGGAGGATSSTSGSGGSGGGGESDSGCGCSVPGDGAATTPLSLVLLAAAAQVISTVRRKRGARRARVACSKANA